MPLTSIHYARCLLLSQKYQEYIQLLHPTRCHHDMAASNIDDVHRTAGQTDIESTVGIAVFDPEALGSFELFLFYRTQARHQHFVVAVEQAILIAQLLYVTLPHGCSNPAAVIEAMLVGRRVARLRSHDRHGQQQYCKKYFFHTLPFLDIFTVALVRFLADRKLYLHRFQLFPLEMQGHLTILGGKSFGTDMETLLSIIKGDFINDSQKHVPSKFYHQNLDYSVQ